ncbi:MAG: hypothetical protein ABH879_01080 [archaeon]
MFNKSELENWLKEIAGFLDRDCSIYLIGGCAMSFRGLKPATKDVDIIVSTKSEFTAFDNAVLKAGYGRKTDLTEEFYLTALAVYEKDDSRIDVFLNEVGKMLKFTKSMKSRTILYKEFGHLKTFLASNEDLFLFKAMTPRVADIDDCDRLMRENLDYNAIYDECIAQSGDEKQWYFWLYEKICSLENKNSIENPIKSRLFRIIQKNWKNRPTDFMCDVKDLNKHIMDENLLNELNKGRAAR